jgi:hypothetical protein
VRGPVAGLQGTAAELDRGTRTRGGFFFFRAMLGGFDLDSAAPLGGVVLGSSEVLVALKFPRFRAEFDRVAPQGWEFW